MTDKGRAPSEKHLEDYLFNNPSLFGEYLLPDDTIHTAYSLPFRQFRLPSGVVDMIGFDWRLCVFELKRGVLKAQALTQLLRYMHDIQYVIDGIMQSLNTDPGYAFRNYHWTGDDYNYARLIRGVLVGNSIEDDNFLLACHACNVDVFTYDYDPRNDPSYCLNEVSFNPAGRDFDHIDDISHIVRGQLGKAYLQFQDETIREIWTNKVKEHNQKFSAVRAAEDAIDETGGDA